MQHKGTIIYTGNFSIENMNAAGKRVFANAFIMQNLGYHLVMVGTDSSDESSIDILRTYSCKDGMDIYHYTNNLFKKHRSNYIFFYKQFEKLLSIKKWDVKAIICYNSPSSSPFMGKVIKYCHKNEIKYITDVADWLIVDSNKPIYRILRQFDITLKNAYYSNKSDGVIAISTWLAGYYKKRVKNVIIVPPLQVNIRESVTKGNLVPKVVYAGVPFRRNAIMRNPHKMKDRFDIACELLNDSKNRGAFFEFHVYGFTKDEMLYSLPRLKNVINNLSNNIVFHGMVPMEEVQNAVRNADYTILIRESNRMSNAGFPTKVSESISCGTPVITTKTSDIDKYADEKNGVFFLRIDDINDSQIKLFDLLTKSKEKRYIQKMRCINNYCFDMDTYLNTFDTFLQKTIDGEIK